MFARTDRLLLRPHWPEEQATILSIINDDAITGHLSKMPWLDNFDSVQSGSPYPNLLMLRRTAGDPVIIGGCRLSKAGHETLVEFWIARPFWGLGYATEAASAIVHIAKSLGHKSLCAYYSAHNPASGNVLHKLGFAPVQGEHSPSAHAGLADFDKIRMTLELAELTPGDIGKGEAAAFIPYDTENSLRAA